MEKKKKENPVGSGKQSSGKGQQGTDKFPDEGKKQKVTTDDLKGKKVDAFPDTEADKPLQQQ